MNLFICDSLTPPADTKPTPAELPRPASDPDYLPSLVLPSIQLEQESKRLTMIGRSPATQHPKDNQAIFWSTQSDSNADEGKDKSKKRAGVKDGRKKGPVKLKYTNRRPVVNASDGATCEPNMASLKGCEPSASPARSASKDDAAVPQHVHIAQPIPKPGTEKAEDLGFHKEPWLPGLVRKELTEEEPQRGLTFYRGRYATFTQAQKVYESKRNPGGVKRLVHGESASIDSDQRLLQGARRSLSVDVTVDSQDVGERDWKSWLSSGSSKKNGFLRVRVACVEGLPTRLVLEGKQQYVPSGEPARHVPPSKVSDPHLHAQQGLGTKGKDSDVVASLPPKEQRDTDTLQVGTDGQQEKQEQSRNSASQEEVGKNKGSTIHVTKPAEVSCDRLKQHKDFTSRTRPKKGTSFKISRNVMTNSPDGITMSESMGIRGKTMTELANSHRSSRGILTNNENNSTMKENIDMKESTPETAEEWQSPEDPDTAKFREKTNATSPVKPTTRPNPLSYGGKNHKNLCDQKGATVRRTVRRGGPSVSSTYPGSLVITGGATRPEADEGLRVDRKEGGQKCPSGGDAHPVTLEFRLGKEEGLSSDRTQPVTVVR